MKYIIILLLSIFLSSHSLLYAQMQFRSTTPNTISTLIPGYSQISFVAIKTISFTPPEAPPSSTPVDGDTTTEQNGPFDFAEPLSVNLMMSEGNVTTTNIGLVWTLKLVINNALSIGLEIDQFNLSQNAEMYVYNSANTELIGPIKKQNFSYVDALGIPDLSGGSITIYILETGNFENLQSVIKISQVYAGYHEINNTTAFLEIYENNNFTVAPEAEFNNFEPNALYETQESKNNYSYRWFTSNCIPSVRCFPDKMPIARSVARFITNGRSCSGTIINNELRNGRPFFLTAFHCLDKNRNKTIEQSELDALRSARVRFQYWTDQCSGTSLNSFIEYSSLIYRAAWPGTDMLLLEMLNPPGVGDGINYAGWSTQSNLPASPGSFIIHHPKGTHMRITHTQSVHHYWVNNNYWQSYYSNGVVQKVSSGAALFNEYNQLIGQLKGGWTSCVFTDYSDRYGKFGISWNSGSNSAHRLSSWLSPNQLLSNLEPLNLSPLIIQGNNDVSCFSNSSYAVPNLSGCTYSWATSSNIQIISGQGTANLVVKGISGVSPSLFGDISVTITDSKGYSRVLSTNKQVNMAIPVTGEINISGNYGGYLHEYNWVLDVTKVRLTTSGLSTTWYFWSGDWPVYFQNNPNGELEFLILGDQTVSFVATSQTPCGNNQNNVYTFHRDGNISSKVITKPINTFLNTDDVNENINKGQSLIKVFPNPTSNALNLIYDKRKTNKNMSMITVFDNTGKSLFSHNVNKIINNFNIDMKAFRGGIYYLQVLFTDKTFETIKVIKQ